LWPNNQDFVNGFPANAGKTLLAAFTAAAASVLCTRAGFMGVFFLIPFALAGFFAGKAALTLAVLPALVGNGLSLFAAWRAVPLDSPADPVFFRWSALYYTVMVAGFCWVNAGPSGNGGDETPSRMFRIPGLYRLVIGALAVSAVLISLLLRFMDDPGFNRALTDTLNAFTPASGRADTSAVAAVNAAEIFGSLMYIGIRGGILASIILFFAMSRQAALLAARLVRHERRGGNLAGFYAGRNLIWLLSLALGAVLLGRIAGIELLEIGAWNVLVLCAALYLAQGGGIAQYFLARLPPLFRALAGLAVILILLMPGAGIMMIPGFLILAGILENWVPFRSFGSGEHNGPPPTP
jgi:hypothetical protein